MNALHDTPSPGCAAETRRWTPHQASERPGALALALFDLIDCALVVCDEQGAVRHANRSARHEMLHGGLFASDLQHLAPAVGTDGDLQSALQQAARRGRRSLLQLVRGGDRLLATVQPMPLPDPSEGLVLVLLGRRRLCSDLGVEMLGASHRLTLAERRVLKALTRCRTPREIAQEHGVTLATVRSQVASIRGKLDTRSVEELLLRAAQVPPVSALLQGAPPLRALSAAA